jgi:hypothetical protein
LRYVAEGRGGREGGREGEGGQARQWILMKMELMKQSDELVETTLTSYSNRRDPPWAPEGRERERAADDDSFICQDQQ